MSKLTLTLGLHYTDNKEKAGQFLLKDENGKAILKGDIVLPEEMHSHQSSRLGNIDCKELPVSEDAKTDKLKEYMTMSEYLVINTPRGELPLLPCSEMEKGKYKGDNKTYGFSNVISMNVENIKKIINLLKSGELIQVETYQNLFMQNQEECGRITDVKF